MSDWLNANLPAVALLLGWVMLLGALIAVAFAAFYLPVNWVWKRLTPTAKVAVVLLTQKDRIAMTGTELLHEWRGKRRDLADRHEEWRRASERRAMRAYELASEGELLADAVAREDVFDNLSDYTRDKVRLILERSEREDTGQDEGE